MENGALRVGDWSIVTVSALGYALRVLILERCELIMWPL
jgi:hypothetical protein